MECREKEIVLRYADIRAAETADYRSLASSKAYFVPMDFEETEDGLRLTFQMDGLLPFTGLGREENVRKYAMLLKTLELQDLVEEFTFSMEPGNLFYDILGNVKILVRDIADKEAENHKDFLKKYKALAGSVLYERYSYEDYMEGGESLLKKKKFTESIYYGNEEEIRGLLQEKIEYEHENLLHEKRIVSRKSWKWLRITAVMLGIMAAAGVAFAGYYAGRIYPYGNAVQSAMNAHIDKNYVALIDAMKNVSLSRMDSHQKYILAEAYVNGENLSTEQKTNILSTLTVNQNEKIFDYWIFIGRQNPVEAENIAMQLLDDELLLYAYLLEQDIVRADTEMEAEEKSTRLDTLDKKIKEYTEKLTQTETE
ncbi:MAG: hypothetical protein NC318_13890 [Blautia sp.]|nr:hypothetical protein [Lachnoclostridium sp.]MCM1212679.1 hypothetical protein [Blautia sp.]